MKKWLDAIGKVSFSKRALGAIVLLGAVAPLSAEPAPSFRITNLTPLNKNQVGYREACGINGRGEVVGRDSGRAFVWSAGRLKYLSSLPGATSTTPCTINNAGQIVGTAAFGDERDDHYVFWQNGKPIDLGASPMFFGRPSLNAQGQVAGAGNASPLRGFVWQAGERQKIGLSIVGGINDQGQVAGAVGEGGEPPSAFKMATWQDGKFTLNGPPNSVAWAINNRGDTLGVQYTGAKALKQEIRPFLQSADKTTWLGLFSGKPVMPVGFNDRRQVIGSALLSQSPYRMRPVLWQNGRWLDMNRLIVPGSGWTLTKVNAINATGQIVGVGSLRGSSCALLLTPIVHAASAST